MRAGIVLRDDFAGEELRVLAKRTEHVGQSRRLLTLALIYDGGSRTAAARYACPCAPRGLPMPHLLGW